ncbi:hypothetical protein J6590_028674 [Homalodisca vitripennis]|nr:hypothetical protein J6590_028674 [Homalodisca vitripennis]
MTYSSNQDGLLPFRSELRSQEPITQKMEKILDLAVQPGLAGSCAWDGRALTRLPCSCYSTPYARTHRIKENCSKLSSRRPLRHFIAYAKLSTPT